VCVCVCVCVCLCRPNNNNNDKLNNLYISLNISKKWTRRDMSNDSDHKCIHFMCTTEERNHLEDEVVDLDERITLNVI
jgi:hypothetical protein